MSWVKKLIVTEEVTQEIIKQAGSSLITIHFGNTTQHPLIAKHHVHSTVTVHLEVCQGLVEQLV